MEIENMTFYWDMISKVFWFLTNFATAGIYAWFLKPFLPGKRQACAVGFSYFISMFLLKVIPLEMWGIVAYSMGCGVIFISMYLVDKKNMRQKIFLAILSLLFQWIAHGAGQPVYSGLLYALGRNSHIRLEIFTILYSVIELLYFLLRCALTFGMVKIVNIVYRDKREELSCYELVLMLLPVSLSVAVYYLKAYFCSVYEGDLGISVWHNHEMFTYLDMLFAILSYGVILAVLVFYQKIKKTQQEERENAVLAGQMADMRNHICQVEKMYEDIRSIRHDMGNHIMILENLYRKSQWGEAEQYAKRLTDAMGESFFHVKSKNPVTDVILEEIWKRAFEMGIDFRCDFFFGRDIPVDAFDMSVILNNGLGNALEGTNGEHPFISVFSSRKNNVFLIEIQNSFHGKLLWDENREVPLSTKKQGEGHGYGLGNIKKIAGKYHGDIAVKSEEGRFILTVMLLLA